MTTAVRFYRVAVIGGGINGLSTAFHLHRLGVSPVAVIEQFPFGHDRGSSHGQSRITRSTYSHADYVRFMQVSRNEEWPRFEHGLGRTLVFDCPGCFFGPADGPIAAYASAVQEAGADVEPIDLAHARRKFPAFHFEPGDQVLLDRTAGIIAAADTLAALRMHLRQKDVDLREETRVDEIDVASDPIRIATARGELWAERIVVAAGSWIGKLLPSFAHRFEVIRQTVGYFELGPNSWPIRPPEFPVWVHLDKGANNIHYGLPEFQRAGIKVARHVTGGRHDDPDSPTGPADADAADLSAFVARKFNSESPQLVAIERCLYTNTGTEDFVLDFDPRDARVLVGSACSGHAFKFGPLVGRILAELCQFGQTTVEPFERCRKRFCFSPGADH